MADPWEALNGDDGAAAAGPRRLEHFAGPDSAPAGTPGLAGHRALAALAAELAEAAAGDEAGASADDASRPDHDDSSENLEAASPPEPPASFPKPRLLSRLPLPGSPGSMRLTDNGHNGAAEGARQSTITLRKRPVPELPAVAPPPAPAAPADPVTEAPAAAPLLTAASNITSIEAWSAHEDDILPRRQVRRARPRWRRH